MANKMSQRWIGAGFALIYCVTLALPVARSGEMAVGAMILVMGWLGLLMFQFGWVGNLLFFALWLLLTFSDRPRAGLVRTLAVLLGLCTLDALVWRNIPTDASDGPITEYGVGYYLWIACMAGMVAWAFVRAARRSDDVGAVFQ